MKHTSKRLLSLILSLVMVLSLTVPAFAANGDETQSEPALTWEKVSSGRAEPLAAGVEKTAEPERDPEEIVRVSIILNDESTLARGYSTIRIADNVNAMNYRAGLKAQQIALADKISAEILNGENLDVVWNITLAANIISANVPYGKIEAIKGLDEVKTVVLEARYEPDAAQDEGDEPNMYRSTYQTGTDKVWEAGITGAGSRVAVIDTGIEVDHISFSGSGLEYSYSLHAAEKEMSYEEYVASLNLLTAAEVQAKADQLNVQIDPNTTYISTKIPYAYNYVDTDYDVTHRNDAQGNHGSHVEGIAAANKYVPSGDGFAEGANGNNKIKGQAYDAQILTMKVFGKNGGAFDSDYMVAIEDAIVLGADSVNLSLGSSSPGMATSPEYQNILDSLTESDTLVCISMGNSYSWSRSAGVNPIYSDDVNYYTGGSPGSFANAFTVASVGSANFNANGRYSISSFSSWGVPSDLSLKPEITAPGGNIQSVNGNNTTGYTGMSGTSMAAPQITGIAALVAQYVRENMGVPEGMNLRQLSQSLIMSTAVPIRMTNNNYIYYPVIEQGAGLARVDKATASKTYILIDPESLPARAPLSAKSNVADGKVKVELGDDPDYVGIYSFAYSLNNLTDQPVTYELDADFFTQNITGSGANQKKNTNIVMLTASTVWTVDGVPIDQVPPAGLADLTGDGLVNATDAQAILDLCAGLIEELAANADKADIDGDGDVDTYDAHLFLKLLSEAQEGAKVTVPAGGSVKIGLTFDLKDSIENYNVKGNYVEGYVFAKEVTADGSEGVDHSIPVMGYYGSWTDPSMFNKGSYLEYKYGGETRTPYLTRVLGTQEAMELQTFLVRYAGEEFGTPIGGNPVVEEDYYDPARNAIAPAFGDEIFSFHYSAVRNSAATRFRVMQEGVEEPIKEIVTGSVYGAYYNTNDGSWYNTNAMPDINYFIPESVPNNAKLTLSFELAPEYYVKEDGSIDWDAMHDGAKISLPVTVDNEEPEIADVAVAVSEMNGNTSLVITAKDNQYIARFRILTEEGDVLLEKGSDRNAQPGDAYSVIFAVPEDTEHFLVEVTDYALNVGTYRVNFNKEELEDPEITLTLDKTDFEIIGKNSEVITATVLPWGVDDSVTWTTSDPAVATVNGRGVVTGVETGTATITATSVAYPELSATATVHVRFIEKTLNGIVCDEHGAAYVIEFNMRGLPEYTKLHEEALSDWVYETAIDRDGTVYVSTYDGSSQSPLHTLNLETMELTQIGTGTSRTYYTDIEAAGENLYGLGILLGIYNTNLYTINKATSARASQMSMTNYTGSGSLVGITFHQSVGTVDYYYLLTQNGIVYDVGLKLNEEGTGIVVESAEQVLDYGYAADINYWQDLYFDGESLYWSRIDLGISRVDIIMAENIVTNGANAKIIRAGSFAVDVWPVGGLFELSKVPGYTPPEPPPEPDYYLFGYINGADYACEGDAANMGIYKFVDGELVATFNQDSFVAVKTTDNADWYMTNGYPGDTATSAVLYNTKTEGLSADKLRVPGNVEVTFTLTPGEEEDTFVLSYVPSEQDSPEDLPGGSLHAVIADEPEDASAGKTILITADEPTTNGLITVTFPNTVTFVSAETSAMKALKVEEGKVTLSYADVEAFETGSLVALLTFSDESVGDVTITTGERNNEHPEEEPVVVTFGGEAVFPEPVYGEPVWVWSEDYSMANAVFPNADESGEDLILPAEIGAETSAPTCEEAGETVYTATVIFRDETYTDVRTVEIPALGHAWGDPEWTWNEELTEASAKFVCGNNSEHEETLAAEISEEITLEPTNLAEGEKTITAKVVFNDNEYTDVKTVPIPMLRLADGFYLIGLNGWDAEDVAAEDKFEANPENEAEYMLETALAAGNEIKVVKIAKDAIAAWYPSNAGNYVVDEAHAGSVIIYFSESYREDWAEFGGFFFIEVKHEHTPGEPVIENAVEPTCTEAGSHDEVVYCTGCGEELSRETVTDPALGHDPQAVEAKAPTCTEPGYTAGSVCARCGEVLEGLEEIAPTGHTLAIDEAVAPTCTEAGLTAGAHCSVCGEILVAQEAIEAPGHDTQVIPAVEATCTEAGSTEGSVCARCGEILTAPEAIEALGHAFGEWTEKTAPTCTELGAEIRTCSRCGETEERAVAALGHNLEMIPVVLPTCTEPGATAGVRCTVCGMILIEPQSVDPLGHAWGEPEWTWNEELTEATAKFVCANDPSHEEELAAEITEEITLEPTDHEEGEKTITAKVVFNGEEYTDVKTVVLDKLEHDCPCAAFTDMPEFGTVEHDAIDWAFTADPQVTNGTSETTFGPEKTVTRGQAVTFLWRAAGCPEPTNTSHSFTDVKESAYYYKAMLWAVEKGITNGTSDTTFSPNKTCTIEQILTFIYRFMDEPEVQTAENPWSDVKDGSFSFQAIMWAFENGIAAPKSETEFGRKDDCTRAAIVTFLYRIITGKGLVE